MISTWHTPTFCVASHVNPFDTSLLLVWEENFQVWYRWEFNMKADKTCLIIYVNFCTGVSKEISYFFHPFLLLSMSVVILMTLLV